jgi:predicted DNA binding CopG/RHH family protein
MRKNYDFSKAQKNPHAKRLKRQVTIRLDEHTVNYFKELSQDIGIPYQTLINLYLRDCAGTGRKLSMAWKQTMKKGA